MCEVIDWYAGNEYSNFNFGRTDSEASGLHRFKPGWGCDEEQLNYYKFDINNKRFITNGQRKHTFIKYFFKKLPIPALRLIGSLFYKQFG